MPGALDIENLTFVKCGRQSQDTLLHHKVHGPSPSGQEQQQHKD